MMHTKLIFTLLLVNSIVVFAESEHSHELEELIVTAPLSQSVANTSLPVTVLSGEQLRMKAGSSIGDTLKQEPGISSQSFGPGVGQPVIRGQSGPRVQVLQNGLGSLDVSSLSPDHANSTEALLAERIEVLRGPSALLYGSGAIGGVVNVIDNRIPEQIPEQPISGAIEQRYDTVNEGKSTVFKLDGGAGMLAWHLDGFYRDSINLQIPGNAIDEPSEAESHGEEEHEEAVFNSHGRLLNSNTRALSGSAGLSIIGEKGLIGFSINHLKNNYGVPPGAHGHGEEDQEEQEPESVRIELKQTRYDMKAEINKPFRFVEKIKLRLGYNDYQHIELENGKPGTTFSNEGFNSRIELVQKPWAFFDHGVIGVQTKNSEFSALGEEAIVPKSDIDNVGFFTVQDIHTDHLTYELGFRVEHQWIDPEGQAESSHTPISFSTSALWNITDSDTLSLSFSRSQRAPDVQELFANGFHAATSTFDIGNPNLIEETSHNLELGIHIHRDWVKANFNFYQNWVQDYIAQINTGSFFDEHEAGIVTSCDEDACIPVFKAQQRDAEFKGFEADVTFMFPETRYGRLETQFFGDFVRGEFTNGENIPRLPPLRYGLQLAWRHNDWQISTRLTRAEQQDNPGINETETAGYWLFTVSGHYRINLTENTEMLVFAKGNNLLDEEIRNSTSFLRNVAPEGGMGVEFGLRFTF